MYRFSTRFAIAVLFVLVAASAFSQTPAPVPPAPQGGMIGGGGGFGSGGGVGSAVMPGPRGMISSRGDNTGTTFTYSFPPGSVVSVVTGAPYSGQNTSSRVQTLADGTHLTQPANTQPMMYRDSMGRTRTERNMFAPPVIAGRQAAPTPPNPIEIEDPVAGYHYVLDPVNRVAHRVAVQTRSMRPMNASNAVNAANTAAMAANPGMNAALSAPRTMPNGQIMTTEMIGTQTLFGLTAMGTRTTITYPVGTYQGNDRPLSMVTETWMAPQYPVLLSKSTGPNGDSTTTMANFSATEPDPALFQIPEGYQIVDETGQFSITIPRPAQ